MFNRVQVFRNAILTGAFALVLFAAVSRAEEWVEGPASSPSTPQLSLPRETEKKEPAAVPASALPGMSAPSPAGTVPEAVVEETSATGEGEASGTPSMDEEPTPETPSSDGETAIPAVSTAPKYHSVLQGDTLWDLAMFYYKDAWKWRKIWNANQPSIKDPDLIYPRQNFIIPDLFTERVAEPVPAPAEETVETDWDAAPEEIVMDSTSTVPVNLPTIRISSSQENSLLVPPEKKAACVISGCLEKKEMISFGDIVTLKVRSGDIRSRMTGVIYHKDRKAKHPVTGRHMGTFYKKVGLLQVEYVDSAKKKITASIVAANDPIAVGDWVLLKE